MFSFYLLLKYIHVFAAIVAVGANITYGVWTARARSDPSHTGFALKGIRLIDNWIANPAYGVLLVTGLLMVWVNSWPLGSLWIIVALVLFLVIAGLGFGVFTPLLRNQIRLVDAGETASPEFGRLARRSASLGPILGVLVLAILAMMVFKPVL